MRDKNLLLIRPQLNLPSSTLTFETGQTLETFQNETLRPILKMQHDLLHALWHNYVEKHRKNVVLTTALVSKSEFIRQTLKTDMKLKNRLLGILIGHFTADEFLFFSENESELTRRMTDLMVPRLLS